jgi:peptide/nickel transport system ATP-binding protein
MKHDILSIENLVVEYHTDDGTAHAVNGLELRLAGGKTVGLVGETGAGKTTTALSVMNLIPRPQGRIIDGRISLDGLDILTKSDKEMRKLRGALVSMIFQDPMTSLNPVLSVGEQIAEVMKLHQGLPAAEAWQQAKNMLAMVGIDGGRLAEYPHQFSGGMKQRVGIAMALACNPKLLIADEPTTALDVTIQAQVLDLIMELKNRLGMSMLLITHDLGIVASLCDDVAIMYAGRIVEYGRTADIFDEHRHPYTMGLFNSLPRIDDRHAALKPIRGLMPDPFNLPTGCPFHERCDYAIDACRTDKPPRRQFSEGHYAECHLEEGTGNE